MKDLLPLGEKIGAQLKARKETVVVAESSTAGLVSAALLAVPGASAYFIGGGAFYTRKSFLALRDTREDMYAGLRGCTEAWACTRLIPGFNLPNAFTNLVRRSFKKPLFVGIMSACIIRGRNICVMFPMSMPSNSACATPTMVIGTVLIRTFFPRTL